jgi:hypothetical protein
MKPKLKEVLPIRPTSQRAELDASVDENVGGFGEPGNKD